MSPSEPVIDWARLRAGDSFAPIRWTLDDAWIDAYLAATGEPDGSLRTQRLAPPLCMSLVKFVKMSLGGRWPPGTLQLADHWRGVRSLRSGESVTFALFVRAVEQWGGRPHVRLGSTVRDERGAVTCEHALTLLWPVGLEGAGHLPAAPRAPAPPSVPAAGRHGPVSGRFDLSRVRAYAAVAAANDPIHVDPDFARATSLGRNIVQGKLMATLVSRLMIATAGPEWHGRGSLDLRLRKPVVVDERIDAWADPDASGGYRVWCTNERGEVVLEGAAGLGE